MTRKEFDLLVYLVEHRGEIVTRERLLDEVWGYERFPTTRTVDTHVLRLRRKFEADPDRPAFILTVHGQGYRVRHAREMLRSAHGRTSMLIRRAPCFASPTSPPRRST